MRVGKAQRAHQSRAATRDGGHGASAFAHPTSAALFLFPVTSRVVDLAGLAASGARGGLAFRHRLGFSQLQGAADRPTDAGVPAPGSIATATHSLVKVPIIEQSLRPCSLLPLPGLRQVSNASVRAACVSALPVE